jgi:MYXO-CTERM domain-containing protein
MKRTLLACLAVVCSMVHGPRAGHAADYYVSVTGDDGVGDGSVAQPWATIDHAVNTIPVAGGDNIWVGDGVYEGTVYISRSFDQRVVIQAQHPYGAILTNVAGGMEAIRIYVNGSANVTFRGFEITNAHDGYECPGGRESYYLIHIQDASDVTIMDNVIHGNNAPGTCNEVIKLNRGDDVYFRNVVIEGNVIYDPANAGGSDLIDSVRPGEIDILDNIFWGNPTQDGSQSFITLKRQAPVLGVPRTPRYRIRRNVFLNWGGATDQAFIQLGEDGVPEPEIEDCLIENNLFIGNSSAPIVGAMQFKGPRNVRVRFNTVVGDLPGSSFGFRVGTEGDNVTVQDIAIEGNIFSDATGSMGRIVNAYGDVDLSTVSLLGNLYWNGGSPLSTDGDLLPDTDPLALLEDPGLETDQSAVVLPRWDRGASAFESGATTIREEFLRLVDTYGALPAASPAIGAATVDPPADDIRGLARDDQPDLGAYEYGVSDPAPDGGVTDGSVSPGLDAVVVGDGGSDPGADPDGGCGCAAAPSSTLPGLLWLVGLGWWLILRRRW